MHEADRAHVEEEVAGRRSSGAAESLPTGKTCGAHGGDETQGSGESMQEAAEASWPMEHKDLGPKLCDGPRAGASDTAGTRHQTAPAPQLHLQPGSEL